MAWSSTIRVKLLPSERDINRLPNLLTAFWTKWWFIFSTTYTEQLQALSIRLCSIIMCPPGGSAELCKVSTLRTRIFDRGQDYCAFSVGPSRPRSFSHILQSYHRGGHFLFFLLVWVSIVTHYQGRACPINMTRHTDANHAHRLNQNQNHLYWSSISTHTRYL